MKITKLINHNRLRIWWYSQAQGWNISKKCFKPLGFIAWLGHIRFSCTIIKPKMILFNPYTLERIDC